MCECGELVQYGSWAGACDHEIACSVLAYVSVYRCVRVRESVPQYGPRPPGFCTSVYFRTVRVSPAFVRCEPTKTLCFGVLYELRELFVRCEPTKALRFCVPYERQELCAVRAYKGFVPLCTVRAPRALRGASLQRLCAYVCCRSFTSFVRCEPTKAFYGVRAPRALRGASLQRLSTVYERQKLCAVRASKGFLPCTSAKSFARCEPPKVLCLCVL